MIAKGYITVEEAVTQLTENSCTVQDYGTYIEVFKGGTRRSMTIWKGSDGIRTIRRHSITRLIRE